MSDTTGQERDGQSDTTGQGERIVWVDTARALGIYLVYYGHLVEAVQHAGVTTALTHQKLVYAFHMPLFILLSGYLAKSHLPGLGAFLKKQAATRLLPVVTFSLMMVPLGPALESLLGWEGWPPAMRAGWVDDWPSLCERLAPPHGEALTGARTRLWEHLDEEARATAMRCARGDSLAPAERDAVAAGINAALAERDLYPAAAYAGADVPPRIRRMLDEGVAGMAELDRVRSRNLELTWYTLFPEEPWWWEDDSFGGRLLEGALSTLRGYPEFNWLTWFLICLFTVELIHFATARLLTSDLRVAAAIPLFAVVGWLATLDMGHREDVWFARESLLLYAFYLLGALLRRTAVLERLPSWAASVGLLGICGAVTLATFPLNPGSPMYAPVVLVNLSQHGHVGLFLLTAATGSLAIVGLARWLPETRLLRWTGRNTLVLMALNELWFNFGNHAMSDVLPMGDSHVQVLLWCGTISVAQMLLLAPLVWALNRFLPQLIGRPRASGPWLPRLVP